MVVRPTGTVTFLFTDIEESTRLWEQHEPATRVAVERHDRMMRERVGEHGGYVFSTAGDAFAVAFDRAGDAVAAAVSAQRALEAEPWPSPIRVRVRMGVHTGEAHERDGDYFGPEVNRAARLMSAGHGGQVLVSGTTAELVEGVGLRELGLHHLRDVSRPERVFQVAGVGSIEDFGPLRSLEHQRGRLPLQRSSFIGREVEVADVAEMVMAERLVTLTGAGGVGKTRLALQVAAELSDRFPDGVWFVALGPVTDPSAVPFAFAEALGLRLGEPDARRAVVGGIGVRQLLLVVDNCEHVLEESALLVDGVLASCANARVLATSRERLGLEGEHGMRVRSLGAAAVDLFAERAAEVRDGFVLAEENEDAIAEICRRVDGIPLAVELAAARVRVLSPAQIAARLDDHFSVLGPGRRGAPSRQQTMRQAIDWSYALLGPAERALFARLAVFVGTFDLDAAELVGSGDDVGDATVLEVLGRLVDRSMVSCSETAGVMRYRLLEPLRQYGLQLLDEDRLELLRARHAAYLVGLAERTETARADGDDLGALRVVDWSFDDIRAAYTWAIRTGRFDVAAELTAPLYAEAQVRQRREVVERARVVLDNAAGLPNDLVGWMTVITAWGDTWADRRIDAINAFEAAADLFERADDPHAAATARGMACGALLFEGRLDAAAAVSQRAFEALPEGDLRGLFCLSFNRTLGVFRGDPEPELRAALADVDGVLASAERAGSHVLMGFAHYVRGRIIGVIDPPQADAAYDRALHHTEKVRFRQIHAAVLALRAADKIVEQPEVAARRLLEAFDYARAAGNWTLTHSWMRYVAVVLTELGRYDDAAVAHGHIEATPLMQLSRQERVLLESARRRLDGCAGRDTLAAALRRGAAMTTQQIVTWAIDTLSAA